MCRDRAAATGKKTIDLEGRLVKDDVKSALRDRQTALSELAMLSASTGSLLTKHL